MWVTYRLSRDLWQAGQHACADAQMRSLAQQKPNDPEQVYAYGLYLSGSDRDRAALAHLIPCRPASGTAIFRNWRADCKVTSAGKR
ncbi:hypothetical protein JS561_12150 [Salmonella enterica subsp. enterica serovar Infantis]|nr:hypothetical protein JS561_12150 [Salmonella enterica subsp. enterica serovar Infantis]